MQLSGLINEGLVASILTGLATVHLSGSLHLLSPSSNAILVFRDGKLLYLGTNRPDESIGNALLCRGVIDLATLEKAIQASKSSSRPRRICGYLVEEGLVPEDAAVDALKEHLVRQLQDLVSWTEGVYRFEQAYVPDDEGLSFKLADLLSELELPQPTEPDDPSNGVDMRRWSEGTPREMHALSLSNLMQQVRHVTFTAELTMHLLSFVGQFAERVVLFSCQRNKFQGIAHSGLEAGDITPTGKIRALGISIEHPTILREAWALGQLVVGPLEPTEGNEKLIRRLGRQAPTTAFAIPLIVANEVQMVIYGDVFEDRPLLSLELLEAGVVQASLALERSMLSDQVRVLEKKLSETRSERSRLAEMTSWEPPTEDS